MYYHLVYFVFIWYIFYSFGIIHKEKSGNPDQEDAVLRGHSVESANQFTTVSNFT
jgi:hypothetical protein